MRFERDRAAAGKRIVHRRRFFNQELADCGIANRNFDIQITRDAVGNFQARLRQQRLVVDVIPIHQLLDEPVQT
ncbi:MAG: hypothetical protein ACREOO_16725, partial [bacterium]